ncbi:hypothetical protein EDB80DRAFT_823865 [Ilyonectria destructans]|nr:hypothetical protein EDB80DRAFT_823865 [Ilyonectria destructans]
MQKHPGPGLIINDAETRLTKCNGLPSDGISHAITLTLTHGYGGQFEVTVQRMADLEDERLRVGWIDLDGKDYHAATSPFDIVASDLSTKTMRYYVESLLPSSVTKIIVDHFSELKPAYQILNTLAKHCKRGVVKKALDCFIAYRLATSLVASDDTNGILQHGRVDNKTSCLHGKVVLSPPINAKLRHMQLLVWEELRTELYEEISKPSTKTNEKWLVVWILLFNLEDVEFDCMNHNLGGQEIEEASVNIEKHIRTFLDDIDLNGKFFDISNGLVVLSVFYYSAFHRETFFKTSQRDLRSAFHGENLDSLVVMRGH